MKENNLHLKPIGLEDQILDAITNTQRDFSSKLKIITDNIDKVEKINGDKVFNVTVEGDYLWFDLEKDKGERYYYPVQYADIWLR